MKQQSSGKRWWISGPGWGLELGPVDLEGTIVTVQCKNRIVVAFERTEQGQLRAAVFEPLDEKAAGYVRGLSINPGSDGKVNLRDNNWEYALDASALGLSNAYEDDAGRSYLSFWEYGLGILDKDGTESPIFRPQRTAVPRSAGPIAMELGADHHHLIPTGIKDELFIADDNQAALPLWRSRRQLPKTVQSRFTGCLLGGGVGDALGAPVEFMKRSEILKHFGPKGITQFATAYRGVGKITDDTQMTMFTAEGLIRAWVRQLMKGLCHVPSVVSHAYVRWLKTQGEEPEMLRNDTCGPSGWLFRQDALHNRRAPGNTCISALKSMTSFGEKARNDSKGCGGVMRVAPVGLIAHRCPLSVADTFDLGVEIAELTHGHPTGSLTAGVLAVMIFALTDAAPLIDALDAAKCFLRLHDRHEETLTAIEKAEELARSGLEPATAIAQLGQGWVAEEALAISIYCALIARNFRHGVTIAVNHDGDSDSTGAITGNLLGTLHGVKAIPKEWLESLELRAIIEELATDLYDTANWEIGEHYPQSRFSDEICEKYPGV